MNLIYRKWYAVKTFITNAASEASRMIRFSHCMQNLNLKFNFFLSLFLLFAQCEIDITISIIKCPQMLHFSDVCWNPEYCKRFFKLLPDFFFYRKEEN